MAAVTVEASQPDAHAGSSAAVFQRIHPDQYLTRFLDKGYRPDGRRIDGWRDVSINVGE
jgi:exosome complex component RRP43